MRIVLVAIVVVPGPRLCVAMTNLHDGPFGSNTESHSWPRKAVAMAHNRKPRRRLDPTPGVLLMRFSGPLFLLAASLGLFLGSPASGQKAPVVPDDVEFEAGIEYANPDNQHLQLDMARPKKRLAGRSMPQRSSCIHGGGFRAGNWPSRATTAPASSSPSTATSPSPSPIGSLRSTSSRPRFTT